MNEKKKIILSFLTGLVVGGIAFAVGFHSLCYFGPPHAWKGGMHKEERADKILNRISKKLKLNEDQKMKVEKIIESKHAQIKDLRNKMHPQFKAIMESAQSEIRLILNPEQQVKFDAMMAKLKKRGEEMEKRMEEKR